ncbi:LacI family DNA-binding transcriptional regulator [Actinomyces sp. MRS3W]|uniref:LacI family DNA-binding transcriptional regulator n=1 Tax=Actinomyces sp. MRS3W TaxID=2800796 RepID=UPI0028FD31EB|nr:LacI family DNA-binding transcriptional regulator [Actinomyces sp. MRS3W]MDU0349752.1 LacI family DNA-binding transcriptional regulator [Actinomyces sp. MRS3W]
MSVNGHDVTQSDVAAAAGVSRSLVSLALSGSPKVAEETRTHIMQVAHTLGYRINASASALARQRSTTIGLVLPNLRNAFFEQVSRSLDDAAAQQGLTVFVAVGAENQERLRRAIDSLLGVRVLGIVLVSPWLTDAQLVALGEEAPTCLIGRRPPGGHVDSVHIDEDHAARVIVSHLASRGVGSLGYVAPRVVDDASRLNREESLRRAAHAAGMTLTTEEAGDDDAGAAIRRLLGSGTPGMGLVAHNDMLAIDAVAVLRELGHAGTDRVPLVSYDNTYLARRAEFALTSLDQPDRRMAHEAVRLVVERAAALARKLDAPPAAQDVPTEGHLVIRSSSTL